MRTVLVCSALTLALSTLHRSRPRPWITEFLPDLAKHIHIHVIFVQRMLNQVTSDHYSLP